MKATHFGAGNIGRGFIGQVLRLNNFELVFIDTNEEIIRQINQNHHYQIEYIDENSTTFLIDKVRALHAVNDKDAVEQTLKVTDIITTSVGVANLKHIAPTLKNALLKRNDKDGSVNILANENAINASDTLKDEIKKLCSKDEWRHIERIAYFVNTAIDRLALSKIENGQHIALVEPYFEWIIDSTQLSPDTPYQLSQVTYVDNLLPFIERKLFIVNAGHAALAYVGALFGYHRIQQALADVQINHLVRDFLSENTAYFITRYLMNEQELLDFIEKTIARHQNPKLSDPIERVGRSPIRKLAENDRLVSPVSKLHELGLKNLSGQKIIAAAYLYNQPKDEEAINLQNTISTLGIKSAVKNISNLNSPLLDSICEIYETVKSNKNSLFLSL